MTACSPRGPGFSEHLGVCTGWLRAFTPHSRGEAERRLAVLPASPGAVMSGDKLCLDNTLPFPAGPFGITTTMGEKDKEKLNQKSPQTKSLEHSSPLKSL